MFTIPSRRDVPSPPNLSFEELRSRAPALPRFRAPAAGLEVYLHETNKTRILAELFTRDNLDLNTNPTARGLIGNEVVVAHDAARAHFENWLFLHELVDAQSRSDLTHRQFRRERSVVHEVELFLEHEKAVRDNMAHTRLMYPAPEGY